MPIPSIIDIDLSGCRTWPCVTLTPIVIGAGQTQHSGLRFERQAGIAGAQFAGSGQLCFARRDDDPILTRRESANSNSLPSLSRASASDMRRSANRAVTRCSSAGPSVQIPTATAVSCPLSGTSRAASSVSPPARSTSLGGSSSGTMR